MRKILPTFYYLDHFNEFVHFLTQYNAHLLRPEDNEFLSTYGEQVRDVQCVLVRSLNRKYPFLLHSSFAYDEIVEPVQALAQCQALTWFTPIPETQYADWLTQLTKQELHELITEATHNPPKKSVSKPDLVALAVEHVGYSEAASTQIFDGYSYRAVDHVIEYGLFLFFGYLGGRLNQFSLRDLGLMRTRKQGSDGARFEDACTAQSNYYWAKALQTLKRALKHKTPLPPLVKDQTTPSGLAQQYRDEYWYIYGKAVFADDPEQAVNLWQRSGHSEAIAKRLRYQYQHGDKEAVAKTLAVLIDDPPNEQVLFFAQDFLERKYHQKRTSTLTDWLRQASDVITLDEIHKNRVERACVDYYQQQGIEAYRLENEPWRALFGLVFWPILFSEKHSAGNEFDFRPYYIVHNNLYAEQAEAVERELALLDDPARAQILLLKRATECYGQRNGIFRWHQVIHQRIMRFFNYLPVEQIQGMLRAMAQDFAMYCDGFPDLGVIKDGQFQFKEIKAQGDVLRKNQLVTLAKMRELGMHVEITRVEWGIDPDQIYVVVDIETTGGRAGNHRITEIGAVKMQRGEVIDQWQSLLNPERIIPKNIIALTGIDQTMVADAPLFADIADNLREFMQGAIFVAHNVNFDYGFIKAEYERLEQRFSMPKLCTVQQMRKAYPKLPSYSLANLTKHFDITMTRHHRAMSDAVAASELLNIINDARNGTNL